MKNRFLSLLCVLALCLGLLPVTALAAPAEGLYVGNYQITSSDTTTYLKAGLTEGSLTEGSENDWTVKYDPSTATLTLSGATITGSGDITSSSKGAGIYAQCNSDQSVSLTIELIGNNNTITGSYGIYVNAEMDTSTYGTDASLTITSEYNGSLEVSGSNHGIFVKSGTGKASLTINDASVVAKTTQTYSGYAGVYVQSSSEANSPQLSLTVNGGSLTASGGGNNDGIQFYVGAPEATNATTSLIVTDNAIVDAKNGGISAKQISNPINTDISATGSNGGIVFDGTEGTVYGDVTLSDSLTINQGETLTIGKDASLTVSEGTTLTNNGTINVESGGKLEGTPTGEGTVVSAPKITTESLPDGTVGTAYNQTLQADNDPTQWSVTSGSLPNGLSLNSDGTITGALTTVGTSTFTVTATNSAGSDSKELSLTVKSVSVTGVTLDQTELSLYTGQSATLTATVTPNDATNPNVTWSSDRSDVATVANGTVTAVKEGTATITATAEDDSNISATCTVTVTQSTYSISADTTALDFSSAYTGYTQPAAQTVMITNTGNQSLTLNQPASTNSFEVGTLSKTALAVGETATFTVQPKAGLSVGTYSENITVSGSEGATVTIPASFTVEQRDNTPYYGITVNAPANGTVTCYAKSAAKGAEVTLTVKPDVGYALDKLTVTDASGKAVDVTKVDEKTYTFVMPGRAVTVEAVFAPSTSGLPFTDVSAGDWFYEAVQFVYENGLMDGVAGNLFAPNATLNRAMAVTILYRLEGSPDLDGENLGYPFADVDGNAWYGDAVYWARCNGIVDGVENNHFDPTGSLTREQMATVLYRYAQYKGADVSASGDLSGFVDSANVSAWAVDAVKWAVGTGLVNGVEGNALAPQGTSTRAQAAAVLMRLSQAMGV
ncbi:MAG: S-layer homology domain-containing protein [Clostridiales bacterium]|nr:S-layer homology domain-containing protein [Clostridiales bacterium]